MRHGSRGGLTSVLALALLGWVAVGCGNEPSGNANNNGNQSGCPEGHRTEGPACVPIFDDPQDCPGPNEMPTLGGGCRTVGVLQCAAAFASDGAGGCEPILPEQECPPGTMEVIGQTACLPVGVLQCGPGFVSDGVGGCDAVLPPGPLGPGSTPCPPGTLALLGSATCQPLGDCGPEPTQGGSPWGLIQGDGTTVYVDATADATGANGSIAAPYPTVGEALAAVQPGGQVAIAAGDYEELLVINKPVRLVGRCAGRVILRGRLFLGQPRPPVRISSSGVGVELRGVTLTGPGVGLEVTGAQQVLLEGAQVRDASDVGVVLQGGADVTLRRVMVARCSSLGVSSQGSTLRVEESVIRDTRPQQSTGWFGRGINAQCDALGACGSVLLSSSLLSGNHEMGVFLMGVESEITGSVIRDTQPAMDTGRFGLGIVAQCDVPTALCGSLAVTESLVTGNRDVGVLITGVDSELVSTVVSDTRSDADTTLGGRGVVSMCHPDVALCGSLSVTSSLVAGNQEVGVLTSGQRTVITGTVVRDTLPDDSGAYGWGIKGQCDQRVGQCGQLQVVESLVSRNSQAGVTTTGLETEVRSSVVRDTLSDSDGLNGHGISAECDPGLGSCGRLRVSSSLVTDNRDVGVVSLGADTEIVASVIRGTLSEEQTVEDGHGVGAQCDDRIDQCGSLLVSGSIISGNREMGIAVSGVDTVVTETVVRDHLPEELTGLGGMGIGAQCDERVGRCGSLQVTSCLVSGNRRVGVFSAGAVTEVIDTVVRDTLSEDEGSTFGSGLHATCDSDIGWDGCGGLTVRSSLVDGNRDTGIVAIGPDLDVEDCVIVNTQAELGTGLRGRGIGAQCNDRVGRCGLATISSSLVAGNEDVGILVLGVVTEIRSTEVRDTVPQALTGEFGRGVGAQCDVRTGQCGSIQLTNSLVTRNVDIGVFFFGVAGTLERSAVTDTRTNDQGEYAGQHGQGIWSLCDDDTGDCGDLAVTSCLVSSSHAAGVAVEGVSGFLADSVVDTVLPQPLDGKYGYGVQIAGLEGAPLPSFHVRQCVLTDAKLSGIFYFRSQGLVTGSTVGGGEYSVLMNEGSSPTIADDNELSGSVTDEPEWANLYPSPAPPPSSPSAEGDQP